MQKVQVKFTGEFGFVNSKYNEFGLMVYVLSNTEGLPIWNGNTRCFNESQITIL